MTVFAKALVAWQQQYGRHNLPWQHTRDPYRVWLSEIMLQQTQVATVLPYYQRFLSVFPTISDLAQAPVDAVLALWSGLGYYSRARNLHRCAQQVVAVHQGQFPRTSAALQELPGIGASTAAAIAAFCFGERTAIFDANVQRVMARQFAYGEDLSRTANKRELLQLTQTTLPKAQPAATLHARMVAYTQGLMDLGATVCKTKQPVCSACPVVFGCAAQRQPEALAYPKKTARQKKTTEHWWLLAVRRLPKSEAKTQLPPAIWLQPRENTGIWAGLHCLPVFANMAEIHIAIQSIQADMPQRTIEQITQSAVEVRHILTHKILHLHIVPLEITSNTQLAMAGDWYMHWQQLGLPAPIRKWLQQCVDI